MPSSGEPLFDLFVRHVQVTDTCWLWTGGSTARNGSGVFWFRDRETGRTRRVVAARWLWEQTVGPIPDGLTLDPYVCGDRGCVRPDHLRPVTHHSANLAKARCPQGHEYTEENTMTNSVGARVCRECNRIRCRESHRRRKARR